jgi:hypothetical protein
MFPPIMRRAARKSHPRNWHRLHLPVIPTRSVREDERFLPRQASGAVDEGWWHDRSGIKSDTIPSGSQPLAGG